MTTEVGTTTICSADALTNGYVLMDDDLQAVYGTDKWFQLYAETQTVLEITYTTGAAETNNYAELYIEFGSGAKDSMTWVRETVDYMDDSANQIVLEEWTYKIDGAAAGTEYTKRIQLPVCSKGIRIYAKEVGVAANYGTLTIKANTVAAGAAFYNRQLQTVSLEVDSEVNLTKVGGVAVPTAGADASSNTRTDVPTSSRISGFNGTTWDRLRAGVKTVTSTLTGWLNTLPWAIYNATPTTRTDGQGGPLEATSEGSLKTRSDAYSSSIAGDIVGEANPLNVQYDDSAINIDTTNVTAATHYYPSATGATMDGYADLSISGKLIDADETLTLTVEMMNDEDTTSGDWVQVYGYDDKNNTTTNSWTVTNGTLTFANSFNNANYTNYRVKVVAGGATNTVIIKGRTKAL